MDVRCVRCVRWGSTYGVARLETSFAIYWRQYFDIRYATGATHHIDTAIPRNSNDAVERSQINTYYRHVYL